MIIHVYCIPQMTLNDALRHLNETTYFLDSNLVIGELTDSTSVSSDPYSITFNGFEKMLDLIEARDFKLFETDDEPDDSFLYEPHFSKKQKRAKRRKMSARKKAHRIELGREIAHAKFEHAKKALDNDDKNRSIKRHQRRKYGKSLHSLPTLSYVKREEYLRDIAHYKPLAHYADIFSNDDDSKDDAREESAVKAEEITVKHVSDEATKKDMSKHDKKVYRTRYGKKTVTSSSFTAPPKKRAHVYVKKLRKASRLF